MDDETEVYINITENGSGRINFVDTPKHIKGLIITNLATCTGIVIIGDQGISIVHDEGFLSEASIEEEFKFVGNIIEWSIFYNPAKLQDKEFNDRQHDMTTHINKHPGQFKGFNPTTTGKIAVHRTQKNISDVATNQDLRTITIQPINPKMRKAVRWLNNKTAHELLSHFGTHRTVTVDIQFDGTNQTNPSPLDRDDDTVRKAARLWLREDKLMIEEYAGYCSLACKSKPGTAHSPYFPSTPPSETEKFHKLQKVYDANHDGNPKILLLLASSAHAAISECSGCYEAQEGYDSEARKYLALALKSDDIRFRNAAIKLKSELYPSSEDESSELENKNCLTK